MSKEDYYEMFLKELTPILNYLYSMEQNCKIESFRDDGWTFYLGDSANGFSASNGPFGDINEGARWMLKAYHGMNKKKKPE